MNGRDKCELLNEVRQRIAKANNIEFDFEECTFEGDCSGTCPKCESEVAYLERELEKKQENGEKIDIEGIFTLKEKEPTELLCKDVFVPFGNFEPVRPKMEILEKSPYCETFGDIDYKDYAFTYLKIFYLGNDEEIVFPYNEKEYDGDITVFEIKEDENE